MVQQRTPVFSFCQSRLSTGLVLLCSIILSSPPKASAMLNKDGFPLPMSFEATSEVMLLFSWWDARTIPQYAVCCLSCVVFGFISIALKVLRRVSEVYLMQAEEKGGQTVILGSFPVFHNAIRASVAFLNYSWDYMLMLVAMTFNVGIFVSMLCGIGLGFLTIGHYLDFTPQSGKIVSGCECGRNASCGCHRGQPCTCCTASHLIHTGRGTKVTSGKPLNRQISLCKAMGACRRPSCELKDV